MTSDTGGRSYTVRFRRAGAGGPLQIAFVDPRDEEAFRREFLTDDAGDTEGHGLKTAAASVSIATVLLLGGAAATARSTQSPATLPDTSGFDGSRQELTYTGPTDLPPIVAPSDGAALEGEPGAPDLADRGRTVL